ncbi:MAG TPA: DoxX family protein [Polyangia bacterium]|nr:DoxX family protein [Polyangia bacterium]
MAQAFLIGRVIVGAYYLMSAYHHFANVHMMTRAAAGHGVPAPEAAVLGAGVLLAIAGVTLLLGAFPRIGVLALVLFLIPVSLFMHPFWSDTNAALRMSDTINFTKNMGLLGSALMFLAIPEPWPYSVGGRLRLRRRVRVTA